MTTTTVNLDGLRELASFRAENGCAISIYLDLDPSIVPTAGDTATRVRSLLDAGSITQPEFDQLKAKALS